ncbi:nitrate reductase molybdenum cofactor assembly chaperone [Ornithinibacillus sp. L9]|uniref:Nitrate reductase molybdenum cofactor assembly chaperone n=1 Tax=Ornithinibacillus caprae TaxID=2678566 RepID=A0A6N8FIB9_9BACI|nr:nitrate reductase molybdenum cofactor assembly chaperone [Ornithinibacillus caprae]MUK88004.1 nitrate reductase molybdenum cofactor assembly chaperone [Ornithinibacillus caprae]
MNRDKRILLISVSRLLGYPSDHFKSDLKELNALVYESLESEKVRAEWKKTFLSFKLLSQKEIQELYVNTFDLKTKTGLYLTAHELGDSSRRGAALIRLQNIIKQAGFEIENKELGDYIPMLLEFLSVAPPSKDKERLISRMGVGIKRIIKNLDLANPYAGLFSLLMDHVFPNPTKEEIEELENNREDADLEELPCPIMYQ